MKFMCWIPENCDEEDATEYDRREVEDAAMAHARHSYMNSDDKQDYQNIHVRSPDGMLSMYTAVTVHRVDFLVQPLK